MWCAVVFNMECVACVRARRVVCSECSVCVVWHVWCVRGVTTVCVACVCVCVARHEQKPRVDQKRKRLHEHHFQETNTDIFITST